MNVLNEFKFLNAGQVMNMGGPWVGDLYYHEKMVAADVIVDNIAWDQTRQWLLFVKYYSPTRWARDIYFTISYLDLSTNEVFESDKKFEMVFIKDVTEGILEIYRAFHDGLPRTKDSFNLYDEEYHRVSGI